MELWSSICVFPRWNIGFSTDSHRYFSLEGYQSTLDSRAQNMGSNGLGSNSAQPLIGCVTLGKLPNLPVHLKNGDNCLLHGNCRKGENSVW